MTPRLADDLDALMVVVFDRPGEVTDRGVGLIERIGASGDARASWVLVDVLRFLLPSDARAAAIANALEELTGVRFPEPWWRAASDQLIAWDLPAPPGYARWKQQAFASVDDRWRPFFDDPDSELDLRLITWGGALIDDRSIEAAREGASCPLGCIPALHHPAVTSAAEGAWYPDEALVFGLLVNGEARAYPKHIMEVHELVTDTLGGRLVAIPYCTLCSSAQAYLVDDPPEGFQPLELRTSGLLNRSNKLMFDLHTFSAVDAFTGRALSGPLRTAGVGLEQLSVVLSDWGSWKAAHPSTTIVAEDGGIGRVYPSDPLGGRDDYGPIFPIGEVDPRLPAQELVLGVEHGDVRIAFPLAAVQLATMQGVRVEFEGVRLVQDGGGFRALDRGGAELVSHSAFWFAWSQFWPETLLWTPSVTD